MTKYLERVVATAPHEKARYPKTEQDEVCNYVFVMTKMPRFMRERQKEKTFSSKNKQTVEKLWGRG